MCVHLCAWLCVYVYACAIVCPRLCDYCLYSLCVVRNVFYENAWVSENVWGKCVNHAWIVCACACVCSLLLWHVRGWDSVL